MANTHKKPKQFIADKQIQGGLMVRVAMYWMASLFVTLVVVAAVSFLQTGTLENLFRYAVPAVVAGLISLPLALVDVVKFSNRFAGPLVNIRRRFGQLADGDAGSEMKLREDDFLVDLADNFNKLRSNYFQQDSATASKPAAETMETTAS